MSYLKSSLGFTSEEETFVDKAVEASVAKRDAVLSKLSRNADDQERLRTITIVAAVGGFIYTLARLGELAAQVRSRREST